jgi:hypothetical protein
MKASRLVPPAAGTPERAALARAVLADEAFALHFLEDSFAAGHVAGTWGKTAVRKGTPRLLQRARPRHAHLGAAPSTCSSGDANLTPAGARRAAETAGPASSRSPTRPAAGSRCPPTLSAATSSPDALDICQLKAMPARPPAPAAAALGLAIIGGLPVPALTDGPGAVPRFRAEIGPYVGLSAAAGASYFNHSFGAEQTSGGAVGGLEMGVRLGYGLEGVIDEAGDGLVFLDFGLRQDTASSMTFTEEEDVARGRSDHGRDPAAYRPDPPRARAVLAGAGDLLLGALFVAPFSMHRYTNMAAEAANGGLIPWQVGLATPIGRVQLVLGREVAISFYGYLRARDRMLMPPVTPDASARLVALRSIAFEFPIVEYQPFRHFSMDQTSMLLFQVVGGFQSAAARP